jgi:hypothetical protein
MKLKLPSSPSSSKISSSSGLGDSNFLFLESLEERMMLSTVQVIAAGTTGAENIELQIDGATVESWNDIGDGAYSGQYVTRTFDTAENVSADQIRIVFTNDEYVPDVSDRNVRIDAVVVDGVRYETEGPEVFSTGTWLPTDGVVAGNRNSEYLHTNGYLQFAGSNNNGSVIEVRARGNEGGEQFNLLIDGQVVSSQTVTQSNQLFRIVAAENVSADQVRIEFTNDDYEPNVRDLNLIVDYVQIDGTKFETEDPSVYSTGTWLPSDGVVAGYRSSETLHTNGYFQFSASEVNAGEIGFTLDSIAISENSGQLNVVVFRGGGSDGTVTVDYATSSGSAGSDDYGTISGTLTFGPGTTGQQLSIPIVNDDLDEANETFNISLSNPTGGASLGSIVTQDVIIEDDDEQVVGVIFEDSFEGSSLWTTNPFGTDTATTGFWEAGSPVGTTSGGDVLQLDSGHTGSRALVTGLAAGTSIGTYDVDGGVTSVISPEINLPANSEVELSFEYSLAYLGNATNDDYFEVFVVVNDNTTLVYSDHAHDNVQAASWQLQTVDLSSFAGETVQILFAAADEQSGSLIEAAVDDVVVEVLPSTPGIINVATTGVNLDESAGTATMVLSRTSGRVGTVSVDYTTIVGTADGNDFSQTSGTATFADGQSEVSISIPIVDDSLEEDLESFRFEISNATGGATIGSDLFGTVTIADNDNTVGDYLPDLIPIASTLTERLSIDTSEQPGRDLLRFSTEVANAGDGPLEIWGGSTTGDSQQVFQRIYQEDGGSRDTLAGEFVYHPGHGHIHFEAFATYDLQLLDANGTIIASGGKTSFCLINIRQPLPDVSDAAGVVHGRGGTSCGQIQGISAGYSDVYSASLDDQWIDITDVADGTYELRIVADPDDNILEMNENNNEASVTVTIQNGQVTSG